jgi:hypothetical protein
MSDQIKFLSVNSALVDVTERKDSSNNAKTEYYSLNELSGLVVNTTTSALSLATLNSTYTTAPIGARVVCRSITGGGLVYTKTTTNTWISQAVTAVS